MRLSVFASLLGRITESPELIPLLQTGPAFFDAIPGAITEITDRSWGMERTEIVCSNCGGHQGHVFRNEGFRESVPFSARLLRSVPY
jgi:hypothetical protein